jgi:hypothetical protein
MFPAIVGPSGAWAAPGAASAGTARLARAAAIRQDRASLSPGPRGSPPVRSWPVRRRPSHPLQPIGPIDVSAS